jgi:catechol 2,3-dioxygenase-like lactoylglutathione lyase family enzyme
MPRLDAIGVIVSDIDRAVDFYGRLGLAFPDDPDPEGHGHVEATLPGGLRLMLDSEEAVRSFNPDWSPSAGDARTALAFLCASPQEVDRVYHELVNAGAQALKEPWDAFWGQRYAEIGDPDGNVVDLFAPLDR